MSDLSKRFIQNPLITPKDIKPSRDNYRVDCVLNPGAFKFDGKICLLLRVAEIVDYNNKDKRYSIIVEEGKHKILEFDVNDKNADFSDSRGIDTADGKSYLTTISHLRLATSVDGINFKIEEKPLIEAEDNLTNYGVEDCRVVKIEDTYYLTYTGASNFGVGVMLKTTKDFKSFKDYGMIISPSNKDCVFFPEKINGKYACLHRPSGGGIGGDYIWTAQSDDLYSWGYHQCIATERKGSWDNKKVGGNAEPIKTDRGWLVIYHGVSMENRYCLGAMLLDLNDINKVISRTKEPIMSPTAEYELEGFFNNVIFCNGQIIDGDKITFYYGASDSVVCAADLSISEILSKL